MRSLVLRRWSVGWLLAAAAAGTLLPWSGVGAQTVDDGPRTTFLFARYATHSSRALYAGYGNSSWQGIVAVIENPRTGYQEALVGLAKGISFNRRQSVIVALAASEASDSRYGELYVVPSLSVGPVAVTGSAEVAVPFEARGAFQYYANPIALHVAITRDLRVGLCYILAGQTGTPTGHALGPSVKAIVPHGSLTLDWVVGLSGYPTETRLSFGTSL
jgi:hypothetical protein